MRLLVVEDDFSDIRISAAGAGRSWVPGGRGVLMATPAEKLAAEAIHDGLIVDLGLPDMDGLDLIARCRAQGKNAVPVLILSARRSVDQGPRGLEQGGDDYLTKPFALSELLARLRNLLRRASPGQNESTRLWSNCRVLGVGI